MKNLYATTKPGQISGRDNNIVAIIKPILQAGTSVKENSDPCMHVTVISPVNVCPVLHFRDTSPPCGTGSCVSVVISVQLSGKLSHETVRKVLIN